MSPGCGDPMFGASTKVVSHVTISLYCDAWQTNVLKMGSDQPVSSIRPFRDWTSIA